MGKATDDKPGVTPPALSLNMEDLQAQIAALLASQKDLEAKIASSSETQKEVKHFLANDEKAIRLRKANASRKMPDPNEVLITIEEKEDPHCTMRMRVPYLPYICDECGADAGSLYRRAAALLPEKKHWRDLPMGERYELTAAMWKKLAPADKEDYKVAVEQHKDAFHRAATRLLVKRKDLPKCWDGRALVDDEATADDFPEEVAQEV